MAGQMVTVRSRAPGSAADVAADIDGMPTTGPLVDRYGRVHRDLRLSLTDRCNLRCVYCMAEGGVRFLPSAHLLTADEIHRLAGVARASGQALPGTDRALHALEELGAAVTSIARAAGSDPDPER